MRVLDTEVLGYELVLCTNVVVECDVREGVQICVGWRAGLPVAEERGDYDAIVFGVEGFVIADEP